MDSAQLKTRTRSRFTLIFLIAVFAAPILLAYVVSSNKSLHPTQTKNNGHLFEPARPLPEFSLNTLDGKTFELDDIRRKWSYVYIDSGTCQQTCQESLDKIRIARLAQAGESLRVQYFLLVTGQPNQSELKTLLEKHPRMILLHGESQVVERIATNFNTSEGEAINAGQVYLVDPIGNAMMYYPKGFDANGLLKDLKYLLHWSQIG